MGFTIVLKLYLHSINLTRLLFLFFLKKTTSFDVIFMNNHCYLRNGVRYNIMSIYVYIYTIHICIYVCVVCVNMSE